MELIDLLPLCEERGHPGARVNLVIHHMDGSYNSDCYCPDCKKPITRLATPEEIAEHRRIQSIPLTSFPRNPYPELCWGMDELEYKSL